MNLFWDLFESRNEKLKAKKFGNVIHPPILCDNIDNETPVIFLLPKPELHLLIDLLIKCMQPLNHSLNHCGQTVKIGSNYATLKKKIIMVVVLLAIKV